MRVYLRGNSYCRLFVVVGILFLFSLSLASKVSAGAERVSNLGKKADLPLPSSKPLVDYEKQLYSWIIKRKYMELGWAVDKEVRDTGPYLNSVYYGTHPAVRIFYSPEVMEWLIKGRPDDEPIADGAIIIKEMFTPPAAIYQELRNNPKYSNDKEYQKAIAGLVNSWTVMVKDSTASADGWFWASVSLPAKGVSIHDSIKSQVDTKKNREDESLRWSGFGMPCIRCHASAENELTFSDLANIANYPGEPLIFKVDDSWRTPDYIASEYPLCTIKSDPFVQSFFYLPPNTNPTEQDCPPKKVNVTEAVSSDHKFADNIAYNIPSTPHSEPNKQFLKTFDQIASSVTPRKFPAEWLDHRVMPADHPTKYVTSDNCLGCHGGLGGSPNRNVMFIPNGDSYTEGFNISEYGEWRWSPMGLAGRDPIFHSQIESEMAILEDNYKNHPDELKGPKGVPKKQVLKDTQHAVTNLCLSCHGAMGQRQLAEDAKTDHSLDGNFSTEYFYLTQALTEKEKKQQEKEGTLKYDQYGALAREGISCMICHHIDAPDANKVAQWKPPVGWVTKDASKELAFNLFFHSTGQFNPGPADKIFGPFDVSEKPMEHALNATPVKNHYTSDSQMCGNCHTINLPNIGATKDAFPVLTATAKGTAFEEYPHTIEQATFLEWQNSAFAVSKSEGGDFQSCQDCHMPNSFENKKAGIKIDKLVTQIATIQDSSYPEAGHTIPLEDLDIPMRDNYQRHTHVGLNVFLLSMFDQFEDILGVKKSDYMTGAKTGVDLALDSMIQQAQDATATIDADITSVEEIAEVIDENGKITVEGKTIVTTDVEVVNLTGHRLPSGVAFRRAFIEFSVFNGKELIWQSGGSNEIGVIQGSNGKDLPTEFLPNDKTYQPHYEQITDENQVQIYEELNLNAQNEFTTSFVHRVTTVKDNRLLPKGWKESRFFKDQGEVMRQFMAATDPHGKAANDADYQSGDNLNFAGRDRLSYKVTLPRLLDVSKLSVRATLYSQSIPPYWLKQRFDEAGDKPATQRLHYMASRLDLDGTPMANWRLKLVSDTDTFDQE